MKNNTSSTTEFRQIPFNMTIAKRISDGSVVGRVSIFNQNGVNLGRALFTHNNPYGDVFTIMPNAETDTEHYTSYLVCFNSEGKSIGEHDRDKWHLVIEIPSECCSKESSDLEWTPAVTAASFQELIDKGVWNNRSFESICCELIALHKRKNKDYGDSFAKTMDTFGITALCIRLHDKLNRLISITNNGKREVKDESVEDTLMDLASYAIMGIEHLYKVNHGPEQD